MPKQNHPPGFHACLFAGAALFFGLVTNVDSCWAKHHKTPKQPGSSDPCAGPAAFIKDQVAKMRELQTSLDGTGPRNIAAWIDQLQGNKSLDQERTSKVSDLRRDAESVNDMLRAGGCQTVDIDEELKKPPTSTGSLSPRKKR